MTDNSGLQWSLLSVFIILTPLFAWSCGGGSGTPPQKLKPANLDQCAAVATADIVLFFADPFSSSGDDVNKRSARSTPESSTLLGQRAIGSVQDASPAGDMVNEDVVRAGSKLESFTCSGGGTSSFNATWTGSEPYPDQYEGLCQVIDATIRLSYSDCVVDGEKKNGSIVSTYNGSGCRPVGISMNYSDYRIEDSASSYFIEYIDFDLEYADLRWEEGELPVEPDSYNLTVHGAIETSIKSMEFNEYLVAVSNDGSVISQSGNGEVTGSGIDGWVTVTAVSPVRRQLDADCPYEGHIQLSGAGDVTVDVVFNSDGSMAIGDQVYDTCNATEFLSECR